LGSFWFPATIKNWNTDFMTHARQKFSFAFFGAKPFAALLFILCLSIFCQTQTVSSETCDFSEHKPFTMSHFLKMALIEQAKPLYPAAGKNVRVQGKVRIKILVDRFGRVRAACALDGHPLLRASAERAARESRFKPNFGLTLPQKRYGRRFIEDELVFNFRLD
jgi:hypothetical protein